MVPGTTSVGGQSTRAGKPTAAPVKKGDWAPRRLPDGQPDMQGIYVPNWPSTVPIERWTDAEADLKEAIAGLPTNERLDAAIDGLSLDASGGRPMERSVS